MIRALRLMILLGLSASLMALVVLVWGDATHSLDSSLHNRTAGGLSLMCVGAVFMLSQWSDGSSGQIKYKELLLGFAFFLWGSEQLMPPASRFVILMDDLVVLIFVIDLGALVYQRWKQAPAKR